MEEIVIGICDDQILAVKEIKSIVLNYCKQKNRNVKIMTFLSGEEVVANYEVLNILFLDIEMPGMDGIEVGGHIFKNNKRCKIVMATSHEERFKEAFKIDAYRFVSKPFSRLEIEAALDDALKTFIGMETVELYENRRAYNIPQKEILFVKAYNGYIEAVVKNRIMRKDISLNKMKEILDHRLFYRISREYLVNLYLIKKYRRGVINIGDYEIKVARRKRKDFEIAFQQFDIDYRE